jgi:hypothetical protein
LREKYEKGEGEKGGRCKGKKKKGEEKLKCEVTGKINEKEE